MTQRLIERYRWRAPVYDLELLPFEPLRRACIDTLALQPGETVLDLGCGTGLSLPLLRQRVGEQGRVVGVEQCPDMIERARTRVARQGWRNVELICAPVAELDWAGPADAALFHFTHDILQDEVALARVCARLAPGARLAAAGLTWAPPWNPLGNAFVLGAALYSVASLQGLDRPWARLQARCSSFTLRRPAPGGFYLANGHLAAVPAPPGT